jgi:hypothetical protein
MKGLLFPTQRYRKKAKKYPDHIYTNSSLSLQKLGSLQVYFLRV